MTVVVDVPEDVTLEALDRVAFGGETVEFSQQALMRMREAHEAFNRYVADHDDQFIYGITSGLGQEARRPQAISETLDARARRIHWAGIAFGGESLPEYVSRAAVFAAFSSFSAGHAAIHPDTAVAAAALLDGALPSLPSLGIAAAGELMPNSILMPLLQPDGRLTAGWGFDAEAGMTGLSAVTARRRLHLADRVFALAIEAFQAPIDAYDPALGAIWRDPYEADALSTLSALLEGSAEERRPFQAPVSYRIIPRLLGQARRSATTLEEVATLSLQADNSNPTFLPPDERSPRGRVLSNGGFHHASTGPALDAMGASWANLGIVAHHLAVTMHRGDVSLLPDRLLPPGHDVTNGYSTTYIEYVPTGAVEEMRRQAAPSLLPIGIAASQQDDVAITTPQAYVAEGRIAGCFDLTLAVMAVSASQALFVTERAAPPALDGFLNTVRKIVPPVDFERYLGEECDALTAAFSKAVESSESAFLLDGRP